MYETRASRAEAQGGWETRRAKGGGGRFGVEGFSSGGLRDGVFVGRKYAAAS